jgi:hypothetical protein
MQQRHAHFIETELWEGDIAPPLHEMKWRLAFSHGRLVEVAQCLKGKRVVDV